MALDAPLKNTNALTTDTLRRGLQRVEDSSHGSSEYGHNNEAYII